MNVIRFDSYGFTKKTCPYQLDKDFGSSFALLSTKRHLTDELDWMLFLFRQIQKLSAKEWTWWTSMYNSNLGWYGTQRNKSMNGRIRSTRCNKRELRPINLRPFPKQQKSETIFAILQILNFIVKAGGGGNNVWSRSQRFWQFD